MEPADAGSPAGTEGPPRPAEAPSRVDLVGAAVALVAPDPERHAADLWGASHGDPQREGVWTFMPYGPFTDRSAMADWMARSASASDALVFAVTDRASGRALGMTSYLRIRPPMAVIEIGGIWYVPEAQRTAVNTESCLLLMRHAFEDLGFRRVEWKCDARNERSRAAALRLGFAFEGVFRQHMIVKGHSRDTAWFSLLDREWPAARRRLEERLGRG